MLHSSTRSIEYWQDDVAGAALVAIYDVVNPSINQLLHPYTCGISQPDQAAHIKWI